MSTEPLSAVDFDPFAGATIAKVVPTTQPQREIWLADRLSEDASLAYNESISLRLRGELNLDAFRAAVQDVIDAHEALRATISEDGRQMFVAEALSIEIAVHDLTSRSEAERASAVADAVAQAVRAPFKLDVGPLVRAALFVAARDEHVLIFTAHHIVCDGWSFGVIVRDLANFYAARIGAGARPGIADSFADYAAEESEREGGDEQRADERYWLSKFEGAPPALDLPTDRPRKAWRTFASRRLDIHIDAELTTQIRRWGARHGAGLPATLIGAFAALLHRISGAPSVVVGMPAAGQSIAGSERLVGHCVNLLPIRFEIDPEAPASALLAQARSVLLDAFEHQRYTFGSLLQKLTLPRDPGRLPLVSVLFNVDQALDEASVRFPGLTFDFGANPRAAENFEIFVNAVPTTHGLRLEVQYNTDLFDESAIQRWMDAYLALLRSGVTDASAQLGRLNLISETAHAELTALQPAASAYERTVLMHEFVERQIDRSGEAVALMFGAQTVTYRELEARANRIANALREMGVQRGVNVGLCVNRGLDMVSAILGILKAGGAHVPLDPSFPPERLSFMVEDAQLGALISEEEHFAKTSAARDRTLLLDADAARIAACSCTRPSRNDQSATSDSPAYIIYTSGSTGRPKGVLVPHGAIANLLTSLRETPGLSAADTLVAVTTISFDIAIVELILPLTVGARVVIAARDQVRDAGALRRLLESSQATVMQATPAGWRILLESGWTGHKQFKAISGGEPLAPDLAAALLQRCGSVWNGYGPTETTVYSTFWQVADSERGVSIGRPVANTSVWILDERQQPCPLGVPGEICIGGDGVTLGYLNRPELTAERFLENRFDARGGRIYRTGDRGRWLASGVLEHLGRLDFQVKIRGYRVELGEIEANLLSIPGVVRAVAMAREDRPGDVRLVAYVVLEPTADLAEEQLRNHLQKILPEYFVPQHFVLLPSIPLSPNGKVDRKALPAPEAPQSDREFAPPRDELEQAVASIMEDVLGLPGLGIHDDFFALGGHSLLAAQLTARLNRAFNLKLTLRTLFDAPTIARLAEKVRAEQSLGATPTQAPIASRAEQHKAPLSIMQERLWFLEQLHPGRVVYNTPSAHRLRGKLDCAAFARAFAEMVRHQPSLRTAIAVENGAALQVVHERIALDLTPEDLTQYAASERESQLRERLERLTNEPFDLTQPPLFRARLFKLADEDHVLLFVPHHIIWDGWSFDLFYAELASTYEAFLAGRPSPLQPLPITYGDYAVWHRKWLEGPEFAQQIAYWRERLADISGVSELPIDRPRRPGMSGEGRTEWLSVDKETTEALRELSRKIDGTLFMTLLAIYYVLLHRVSGQTQLVVGTPVRGRNLTEVEQVMGYFTNLLPLHLRVDAQEPFSTFVQRVKATVLDSFAHPDAPLEMLLRELTVQRGEGGSLLYQALFSFQDARHRTANWGGLSHQQLLLFQRGATEDLGLWFLDNDHGMVGGVTYNADIITDESARLLRERYLALLESVLAAPDAPIGQLSIELPADRETLAAFNDTDRQFDTPARVHRLFELAADRAPQSPALIAGGWSVSHQDIERQANRIAHVLRTRGVGAGQVVALCEEPGQGFLSGLLAIFKLGAICLPLDPTLAAARLRRAIALANATALLGNSRFADTAAGAALTTLWLDSEAHEIASAPDNRPAVAESAASGDLALLTDLVGLHAQPRLVGWTHDGIAHTLHAMRESSSLTAEHRCLAAGPICGEPTLLQWMLPWSVGAAVVTTSSDALHNAAGLRRDIESGKATFIPLPTECWPHLFASGWRAAPETIGVLCGERPTVDLTEQVCSNEGVFLRAWGVAETGVWTVVGRIEKPEDAYVCGRPLANSKLRVLNNDDRDSAINTWGELCVSGKSLASGYFGATAQTSERFVALPDSRAQWFRTRLIARWRADGRLELQERADAPTFVDNIRLDLTGIAARLRELTSVDDAACVLRSASQGRLSITAYVATSDPELRNSLRELLRDTLPSIFGAPEVVVMSALPRTSSGALDARALPAPEAQHVHETQQFIEPSTDTEKLLASIWCDLLGVPKVSSRDNFFDLGGHSLLAMQAISLMEQKTGRQVAARRYMFQTLAQLASSYEEPLAAAPAKKGFVSKLLGALRGGKHT